MNCPLCKARLQILSGTYKYECHCQTPLPNFRYEYEGDYIIWVEVQGGSLEFLFEAEDCSWTISLRNENSEGISQKSQIIAQRYGKISPDEAIPLINRYKKLIPFS